MHFLRVGKSSQGRTVRLGKFILDGFQAGEFTYHSRRILWPDERYTIELDGGSDVPGTLVGHFCFIYLLSSLEQ